MEAFGELLPYLAGSAMILLSSLLLVTALVDIRSQRRKVFSPTALVVEAVAILVLTIYLIFVADAVFFDSTNGAHSPWSDWGVRLGS